MKNKHTGGEDSTNHGIECIRILIDRTELRELRASGMR